MADPYLEFATFSASACAAAAASFAAFISYKIAVQSAYPDVVVYSMQDERRPSILLLVIENIGKAPAYNIVFRSNEPIPDRAFGFDPASTKPVHYMKDGPFITGIPFLPPSGKRTITWGQFGGLSAALKNREIRITSEYYPKESIVGVISLLRSVSIIEINSHEGTDASESDPLYRIATAIEKHNKKVGIQ